MSSTVDMTKRAKVVLDKFTENAEQTGGYDVFQEAEVYLGADVSGSMRGYYNDPRKPVTHLAKQIAALALARLDPDGKIPFWLFGTHVEGPWTITGENLEPQKGRFGRTKDDAITDAVSKARGGSTNMADAVKAIVDEHEATGLSKPGLAIIQTDGMPNSQDAVIAQVVRASQLNLFLVFVGYGEDGMPFLNKLNRGKFRGQVVDNVYAFGVGDDPLSHTDEWLWEQLLKEIPQWRQAADGKVRGAV